MMGRSHVVASAATCVAAASVGRLVLDSGAEVLTPAREAVDLVVSRYVLVTPNPWLEFVWASGCALLFFLGTILPDIDQPNSLVCSMLRFSIPLPHRRVTHSLWACILFLVLGLRVRPLMYLFAGYVVHVLMDKPSYAGVCLLWPFTRYEEYPNGAFVARGHKLKLYRTGEGSEILFVVFVWCVSLVLAWAAFGDYILTFVRRG